MTITKSQWVERILIVRNEDGSIKGAQQEQFVIVRDGDSIISSQQLAAEPVDPRILAGLIDSGPIISQLAQVTAERDTLSQDKELLRDQLHSALQDVATYHAQVEDLQAEVALLQSQLNPPIPDTQVYPFVMQSRFTSAQRRAIWRSDDEHVVDLVIQLTTVRMVDVGSPSVQQGIGYLALIGLIDQADVARILAPMTPEERG